MPRGALSWARLMVSRGTVIWGGGSNPSVVGGHSCIYMHILAIYIHGIYMHIHALTWAGNIYMHICAYTVSQTKCPSTGNIIHAYMFKFMHILAYTCIYCVFSYMIIYIDHDAILLHILAYTCIYCQQQLY